MLCRRLPVLLCRAERDQCAVVPLPTPSPPHGTVIKGSYFLHDTRYLLADRGHQARHRGSVHVGRAQQDGTLIANVQWRAVQARGYLLFNGAINGRDEVVSM